ncbi:MAG: hypothetical protein KJ604_20965, partial [Gammaproteobacteria bacterium]|nr:hypothetical protein [Gammaproteobacteria bacterium]
ITDKRTGDTVEIKLKQKADVSTITDADFLVTPENTAVKVKLPHGSTITVTKSNAKLTNTKILHLADNDDKFTDIADKEETSYDVEVQSDISVRVGASADDAIVYWDNTQWVIGALTGLHTGVGYASSTSFKQGNGFRFDGIAIPNAATIDLANLIFTGSVAKSNNNVNSVVIGEDADDAATFSTLANYQGRRGTVVGGANNNNITTASVTWNAIAAWSVDESGADTTSPDIKSIIQEIVNRVGWASGNAIVLYHDDHAGNSTATDATNRNAYTWDNASAKAPLLEIDYTVLIAIEAIASEVSAIVISVPEIVQSISVEAQSCEVASIVVGAAEPRNIILAVASEFDITSSTPDIALSIWIEAVTCGISSIDTAATDITLSIAIENQPMVVVVGLALPVPSFILEMVAAELSVALSIPVILIPLAKNIIDDYNSTKVNNMQPNIIGDNKPVNIDSVTAQTIHSYYPRSVREN